MPEPAASRCSATQAIDPRSTRTMADWCRAAGVQLAPHAKTHMSRDLVRRQTAAGAWGFTAATPAQVRTALISASVPVVDDPGTGSPNRLTSNRDVPAEVAARLEQAGFRAQKALDGVYAVRR